MCRIVLLDQTQYVSHQLGAGLPSIPGRGVAAPPDKITRPTSVHVAVVQQLLNQIALATGYAAISNTSGTGVTNWRTLSRGIELSLPLLSSRTRGALTSLRDELRVARGDVERSRDEITALQTLVDAHHREHKALCEMLERKGILHRKKQRTDGTA
uniref:Uncharacterized protein n=1 Tax=Peronospora matthiolae TaxID=2874970 RepID=A0AAV1UA76_9STRA